MALTKADMLICARSVARTSWQAADAWRVRRSTTRASSRGLCRGRRAAPPGVPRGARRHRRRSRPLSPDLPAYLS